MLKTAHLLLSLALLALGCDASTIDPDHADDESARVAALATPDAGPPPVVHTNPDGTLKAITFTDAQNIGHRLLFSYGQVAVPHVGLTPATSFTRTYRYASARVMQHGVELGRLTTAISFEDAVMAQELEAYGKTSQCVEDFSHALATYAGTLTHIVTVDGVEVTRHSAPWVQHGDPPFHCNAAADFPWLTRELALYAPALPALAAQQDADAQAALAAAGLPANLGVGMVFLAALPAPPAPHKQSLVAPTLNPVRTLQCTFEVALCRPIIKTSCTAAFPEAAPVCDIFATMFCAAGGLACSGGFDPPRQDDPGAPSNQNDFPPGWSGPVPPLCPLMFRDCNHVRADGCETFVAGDRCNCGSCGQTCSPGEECVAGHCGNVPSHPPGGGGHCTAVSEDVFLQGCLHPDWPRPPGDPCRCACAAHRAVQVHDCNPPRRDDDGVMVDVNGICAGECDPNVCH